MHAIHCLTGRPIAVAIVLALLTLFPSCASTPAPPVSQPPRLPPPPPYESYRGEAADVRRVLDSIERNPHASAPRAVPAPPPATYPAPQPYPHPPGSPATLTLRNATDCQLGLYLGGPIFRQFGVGAGRSVTLDIVAGKYLFGVDTHLCAAKVPPLFGQEVFEAGSSYTLTLSMEEIRPRKGQFVIENNTGAKLMIEVGGVTHTLASGSFTLDLPAGSYTASVS